MTQENKNGGSRSPALTILSLLLSKPQYSKGTHWKPQYSKGAHSAPPTMPYKPKPPATRLRNTQGSILNRGQGPSGWGHFPCLLPDRYFLKSASFWEHPTEYQSQLAQGFQCLFSTQEQIHSEKKRMTFTE